MPDGWQRAPIGGEQAFTLRDEQIYGTDLEQTLELLRRSHTTFIGPGSPYEVEYGAPCRLASTGSWKQLAIESTLPG